MHSSSQTTNEQLLHRIYNEFMEMPGLQLTARQAQRLFGLTEQVCDAVLASLVHEKFLVLRPDGRYARLTDGRGERSPRFSLIAGRMHTLVRRTA